MSPAHRQPAVSRFFVKGTAGAAVAAGAAAVAAVSDHFSQINSLGQDSIPPANQIPATAVSLNGRQQDVGTVLQRDVPPDPPQPDLELLCEGLLAGVGRLALAAGRLFLGHGAPVA